jgi:hypothetical protein
MKIQPITLKEPEKTFLKVVKEVFQPIPQEKGWKVMICGEWYKKKDGARTYASLNAAKDRTEQEFYWNFRQAFEKENKALHDACDKVTYPDGHGAGKRCVVDEHTTRGLGYWNKLETKSFRVFLNSLYKSGVIKYVEIGKEECDTTAGNAKQSMTQ